MKRFKEWGERERRIVAAFFMGGLLAGGCSSSHLLGDLGAGGQSSMGGEAGGLGGQAGAQTGAGGQAIGLGGTPGGPFGLGGQAGAQPPAPPFDAGYPGDGASLGARTSWTGYIESYTPPSGSDALKMSFAFDPTTNVVIGTVTFGTAAGPATATDPSVGYPPGINYADPLAYPFDGFTYTMARGSLVNERLRFTIWLPELWSGWCGLQTPPPGSNFCVPDWGYTPLPSNGPCYQYNPNTNAMVAVDCGKLALCIDPAPICGCSAAGCVANLNLASVAFDMALSVNGADGSIIGHIGDHNIRLTQDP
jgi:hypothetical protein